MRAKYGSRLLLCLALPADIAYHRHLGEPTHSDLRMMDEVFFFAKIVEIRQVSNTDRVIGPLRDNAATVAVLQCTRIDRGSDSRISGGQIVVCPIGKEERDVWEDKVQRFSDQETFFMRRRAGKRESVIHTGC